MSQTPTERQTRSNSKPNSHASLTDIKTLMETILTDKLGSLEKKIDNVTDSLKMIISRIEDIEGKYKEVESRCKRIEEQQMDTFSEIDERERRKVNLVISGIEEKEDGNVQERIEWDEEKVEELFEDLAGLDSDDFVKTLRLGKTGTKKPRLLKVVCKNYETKRKILTKAKELRSKAGYKGIYVNPDQTPLQQRQSKSVREEYKRRKDLGEDVVISKNKVVARQHFH